MQKTYLFLALAGTIIPWVPFAPFLAEAGVSPVTILAALYVNGATAGITNDFFICCLVFWVFMARDSKSHGVRAWWLLIPATLLVGLSMALPTYLYLRERRLQA